MTASSITATTVEPTPPRRSPETPETELSEHLRTRFLRRVAHDIASPSGVAITVLEELATTDLPRPELLAMARRSMRRLMRLSEQLALVAELEADQLALELTPVDLRALARQALDEAAAVDGRKGVVTTSDMTPGALLATADARLLLVVMREVVGNALKVASSRVEVSVATDEGGTAVMRVDDDGPGFSEEAAATLASRFVERASARGLGLSLSMGVEILRAHGGSLAVTSSRLPPGRRGKAGAAVVLTLPLGAWATKP
jgi:signal transduction histidine kinase